MNMADTEENSDNAGNTTESLYSKNYNSESTSRCEGINHSESNTNGKSESAGKTAESSYSDGYNSESTKRSQSNTHPTADANGNDDNADKAADSMYSNSYNSESTNSRSYKSELHSGSNSSGSSGYGGKPSSDSSGCSKHAKRMKTKESKSEETAVKPEAVKPKTPEPQANSFAAELEETPDHPVPIQGTFEETTSAKENVKPKVEKNDQVPEVSKEEFLFVVSMENGVVMHTTNSLLDTLGYSPEMWVGRSIIDFVHQNDHEMFASKISNIEESSTCNHTNETLPKTIVSLYCRLRRYKVVASTSFEVKKNTNAYLPFNLILSFYGKSQEANKEEKCDNTEVVVDNKDDISKYKGAYIVIKAKLITSAYKVSMESVTKGAIFNMRHSVQGAIEYLDAASIPYLGYMPHELIGKCAIKMYHPEDRLYLRRIYETVLKIGQAPKSSLRMLTNNGDYVRVEIEFTCNFNTWSKKIKYIAGQHEVMQGPCQIDVFRQPVAETSYLTKKVTTDYEIILHKTSRINDESLTERAAISKQQITRKLHNISKVMEYRERSDKDMDIEFASRGQSLSEKGSALVGGISNNSEYHDSRSGSTDTSPNYYQMNYKGILKKFFDSEPLTFTNNEDITGDAKSELHSPSSIHYGNTFAITESDDEDAGMVLFNSFKDKSCPRLTETSLKQHNKEMEALLSKENHETRYRSKKKTFSRHRLSHLLRGNEFSDRNSSTNVFVHPRQTFRHNTIVDGEIYDTSDGGQRRHEIPSNLKRYSAPNIRSNNISSNDPKNSQFKGLKRELPMDSMPENGRLQKQIKLGNYCRESSNTPVNNISFEPFSNLVPVMLYPNVYGQPVVYVPVHEPTDVSNTATMSDNKCEQIMPINQGLDDFLINCSDNKRQSSESDQDMAYRTEVDTSSSFYSSFLKMNSSGDDQIKSSSDNDSASRNRSKCKKWVEGQITYAANVSTVGAYGKDTRIKINQNKKKVEPPWMSEISPTSDLFYRYQVPQKSQKEILFKDKSFLENFHQSEEVNNQLDQLYNYLDQQGEKLTLEESNTSSESQGEETVPQNAECIKITPSCKLAMIYEEDAPMPPPEGISIDKYCMKNVTHNFELITNSETASSSKAVQGGGTSEVLDNGVI